MRYVVVKNVGQVVQAVTDWDGVSHINVKKDHTLIQSDDPKVVEGVQVKIDDLQMQAAKNEHTRAEQAQADRAAANQRRLDAARAVLKGETDTSGVPAKPTDKNDENRLDG